MTPITKRPAPPFEQPPAAWPEFGEYARQKYPEELDEDLIFLIERLIILQKDRQYHHGRSAI